MRASLSVSLSLKTKTKTQRERERERERERNGFRCDGRHDGKNDPAKLLLITERLLVGQVNTLSLHMADFSLLKLPSPLVSLGLITRKIGVPGWLGGFCTRLLVSAQVMISPVPEIRPQVGLCVDSAEPVWDSLSPSLCPSPARARARLLSFSKINKK